MGRYYFSDFEGLNDFMDRRHFSNDLKQKYKKTYKLSIKSGDGKVWTDSLLLTALTSNSGKINNLISSLPGGRGKILTSTRFENTLTKQILRPDFHPQTIIDEELMYYTNTNPEEEVTEETLFLIEIQAAIDEIGDRFTDLCIFLSYLLYQYNEFRHTDNSHDKRTNFLRNQFSTKIYDAFILSFFVKIHPFDIFDINTVKHADFHSLAMYYNDTNCLKKLKKFLYLMRDSINASYTIIPDDILEKIINSWSNEEFASICMLTDEMSLEEEFTSSYKDATYYATALLSKEDYPLILLLDRLRDISSYSKDNNWSQNEKLILYLDNKFKKIKILPIDYYGIDQYEYKNGIYQKINYGFSSPNPIWNESILETLEYYIEKNELEKVFQYFFELYPDFILDDLHIKPIPQPILSNEDGRILKPDFIVQKVGSENLDIIEIKRPIKKVIFGDDNRPVFCNELKKGIAQLNDYKEWFNDSRNRKAFYDNYKLNGFNPTLTLIIGRNSGFRNENVRRRVTEGSNVNILTYDDIINISKQRRLRSI
jgi:hypothetical protein